MLHLPQRVDGATLSDIAVSLYQRYKYEFSRTNAKTLEGLEGMFLRIRDLFFLDFEGMGTIAEGHCLAKKLSLCENRWGWQVHQIRGLEQQKIFLPATQVEDG